MTDHDARYAAIATDALQNASDITQVIEARCGTRDPEVFIGHPNCSTSLLHGWGRNYAVAHAALALAEAIQLAGQCGVDADAVLDVFRFDDIAADARTLDDELDQLTGGGDA